MSQFRIKRPRALVVSYNRTPPEEHNFFQKLFRMQEAGLLPQIGACELRILHDDDCGFLRGGRCDCDPEFRLMWPPSTGEGAVQ